tara:strand:- start:288 stop:536 length:249 start_codon:yes stop_codon:yes gene_type:complete
MSLVTLEITSPFFFSVKKLILKFIILLNREFLKFVTTLTLTLASMTAEKYLNKFAKKTEQSITRQTNWRASFLPPSVIKLLK